MEPLVSAEGESKNTAKLWGPYYFARRGVSPLCGSIRACQVLDGLSSRAGNSGDARRCHRRKTTLRACATKPVSQLTQSETPSTGHACVVA